MIKIIVIGHGNFASGMQSALEFIAGCQEEVYFIDFNLDLDQEKLLSKLNGLIADENPSLILCDLLGGTPFKTAATLMIQTNDRILNVIGGVNLAMLLDAVSSRANQDFINNLKASASQGINDCRSLLLAAESQEDYSGGI